MSFKVKEKPIETFTAVKYDGNNKEEIIEMLKSWNYTFEINDNNDISIFLQPEQNNNKLDLKEGYYIVTGYTDLRFYFSENDFNTYFFNADKNRFKLDGK